MAKKIASVTPDIVPTALLNALGERKAGIDSAELLSAIIGQWGGAPELAKSLHQEYHAADKGSLVRQRFLGMIHHLIINNTDKGLGQRKAASDMTDAELAAFAASQMNKVVIAAAKEATDGLEGEMEQEE